MLPGIDEARRGLPLGGSCCGPRCACIDCTMAPDTGEGHAGRDGRAIAIPGVVSLLAPPGSLAEVRVRCAPSVTNDEGRALAEAHSALKPGGRLVVVGTTWVVEPPAEVRTSLRRTMSCLAAAPTLDGYIDRLVRAGFREVRAGRLPGATRTPVVGWEPPVAGVGPTLNVALTAIK